MSINNIVVESRSKMSFSTIVLDYLMLYKPSLKE